MPDLVVNTQSAGYQTHLQNFRDLKSYYGPQLKLYFTLDESQKEAWRQSDPILWELLDFSRKVHTASEDV